MVRAGDESLHTKWLDKCENRNFDLFISYYGTVAGKFESQAEYYECVPGLKWPILASLFRSDADSFLAYDACWFPDDDLLIDGQSLNRMFDLFHEYNLWLAQPALGNGSYMTYPGVAQVKQTRLRYTGFVEIMCPIFSRYALTVLGSSFGEAATGWGLDFLWAHLLKHPTDKMAIIDETPVIHTRPVGGGSFYLECEKLKLNAREDMLRIFKQHGIEWQPDISVYNSVPRI